MKRQAPFSNYGNPHSPFLGQDQVVDPMNNFHGVFLTDTGRRKSTLKGKGKFQSASAIEGEAVHAMVQSEFAVRGRLAAAELTVVDMPNQMVSKLDVLTKDNEAIEIKTVSLAELTLMNAPRPEHKLQLIYYLNSLNTGAGNLRGIILYVAREAPGVRKAFEVNKDGEAKEMEGAAVAYMQTRRGGVSPSKMKSSLDYSIAEQKSVEDYKKDFAKNAAESRKLRRRSLTSQKKKLSIKPTSKHIKD